MLGPCGLPRSGKEILDRLSQLSLQDTSQAADTVAPQVPVLPGPALPFSAVAHESTQWEVCLSSVASCVLHVVCVCVCVCVWGGGD
jgi:hypothetical protein